MGSENHATGNGEGEEGAARRREVWMVGYRRDHDMCPPIGGGLQCAEGLNDSGQASGEV